MADEKKEEKQEPKAVDKSKKGWEHYEDYKDGFHDRLASNWPEPADQLHSGGWAETKHMIKDLGLDRPEAKAWHVLDLCCGTGSTGVYIAKQFGVKVTGLDIVEDAIKKANAYAAKEGVADKAQFVAANAFHMPFPDATFDHAYGQDPDALSHTDRVEIFKEMKRVLKPGGTFVFHHHWIPGLDFPADKLKELNSKTEALGWRAMEGCSADNYVRDIKAAGLTLISAEDIGWLASAHLRGMAIHHYKKFGAVQDKWLALVLDYLEEGLRFGVRAKMRNPAPP